MLNRFKTLVRPRTPVSESPHGATGYVYVTEIDGHSLRAAAVGAVVRNASAGPPWIVVNGSTESVTVARWPGRLLYCEVLEAAKEQPRAYANYTRAVAVRVLDELNTIQLLGQHGERIAEVIERSGQLTVDEALALSSATDPRAPELYSGAWKTWLEKAGAPAVHHEADHRHTLSLFAGHQSSPVGHALMLVHLQLSRRAESLLGNEAMCLDEDGETTLAVPWQGACEALLHATMAFGVPDLLTGEQVSMLTLPWRTVLEVQVGMFDRSLGKANAEVRRP